MGVSTHVILSVLMLAICSQQIAQAIRQDSSINQKINQDIKGAVKGSINQVINQDVDNAKHHSNTGSINQVISQDVVSADCGSKPESINQNIHQKVKQGSTYIDQKSTRAFKTHEKRHSEPSCSEEIVFKRHHSKSHDCEESVDSFEEIKVCDSKHSSEICFKNHEEKCGDVSKDSDEEIRIKFKKDDCECQKKPCECGEIILPKPAAKSCKISIPVSNCDTPKPRSCEESSEEIIIIKSRPKACGKKPKLCEAISEGQDRKPCFKPKPCASKPKPSGVEDDSEEIIIRPKPCSAKSSEKVVLKSFFRPCENPKVCDVSSEEIGVRPKPCGLKKCEDKSEEKECPCNKPKPCDCEESSEEIIIPPAPCNKPKPCSCKQCEDSEEIIIKPVSCHKPKPCDCKNCEESSEGKRIIRPAPCNNRKPCRCPTCEDRSEEIVVKPCFSQHPKPCDSDSSDEEIIVKPCLQRKPCFTPMLKPFSSEDNSDEIVFKPWPVAKPCDQPISKPCFKPKPCDDSEEYLTKVIPARIFERPVVPNNCQRCQRSASDGQHVQADKVNEIKKEESCTAKEKET